MALGRLWAGRIFGTNTANVFVRLDDGPDNELVGILRINEVGVGVLTYSLHGSFDGEKLRITGEPTNRIEGIDAGRMTATAELSSRGELSGEWESDIGTGGTLHLFPHDRSQGVDHSGVEISEQLHTARHQFGAITIDRHEVTTIADELQSEFKKAQVVVTVASGSEQSRLLSDFKSINFGSKRAAVVKLFVRESESTGIDRIVQVEFGPQINFAMTQGSDEAWVLGSLEKLKRAIKPFERTYATKFKRMNFGINQMMLAGAVVFLPSLPSLSARAVLMLGVLIIIFIVNWLHGRYLPLAAIYLSEKPKTVVDRLAPGFISWLIAATASLVAALLAASLNGWLKFPS